MLTICISMFGPVEHTERIAKPVVYVSIIIIIIKPKYA